MGGIGNDFRSSGAFRSELVKADGFFHNDYASLGKDIAARFRKDGNADALAMFFETEVQEYFFEDFAARYTALAFVSALTDSELVSLAKSAPRATAAIKAELKKPAFNIFDDPAFEKANGRFDFAVNFSRRPAPNWLAPY